MATTDEATLSMGGPWKCPVCGADIDALWFDRQEAVATAAGGKIRIAACAKHFENPKSSDYQNAIVKFARAIAYTLKG